MSEQDTAGKLHYPADLHDRSLAGWGIRRRRGDLASPVAGPPEIPVSDSRALDTEPEVLASPDVGLEKTSERVSPAVNPLGLADLANLADLADFADLAD